MDYAQIISVFGIAVPVCVTVLAWFWKTCHERKAVKVALVAEILALRDIAINRNYLPKLKEAAADERKLSESERSIVKFRVSVPEHYCRVYVAHITKLGALKLKDANLIVRFYQYADSVIRDVSPGGVLHKGTYDLEVIDENVQILTLALQVADELERRNPMGN